METVRKGREKEGDMGIGTMIIFIAMVLVAAVAASLLISTAGSLNQQAQETGRLAQQDVSSGFVVVETIGAVYNNQYITDIYIKLRLSAGSPAIDMDNVIIEVTNDDFEGSLQYSTSNADDDEYKVEDPDGNSGVIRDPEGNFGTPTSDSSQHIVSQGTIVMVHIDIDYVCDSDGTDNDGLSPQDTLYVKIIPKHGTPTYEEIHVPEVIYGSYMILS